MDAPDYELEYNNRRRVPEHGDIIAGWSADAAAYRATANCSLDMRYDRSGRTKYDLFLPQGAKVKGTPLALFIHGGYWQALDAKHFSHLARGLNARGIAVAIASYDLCPDVSIRDIVGQIRILCRTVWRRNKIRPAVFGHSAGGHLTAAMIGTDWPQMDGVPPGLVSAGYAISGLYDLQPLCHVSINEALCLSQEVAHDVSPVFWRPFPGARLVAAVGDAESSEFKRQSRLITDDWRQKGAETTYSEIAGANHFTILDGLSDPDNAMVETVAEMALAGI